MGDYRAERARIRLSDAIEGLDPNEGIDPTELCWIDPTKIDANTCGVRPLSDFYAADYQSWVEDDKWFPAEEGLATVNGLLSHYQRILKEGADPLGRKMLIIEKNAAILGKLAEVLHAADEAGVWFCVAVSD